MTDFIITRSGIRFTPLDPKPEMIIASDIAHALAHQNRYAGHTRFPYSVALHSMLIAQKLIEEGARPEVVLWALLHDAPEAYIMDIPRPVKRMIPEHTRIEERIMNVIAFRFGMPHKIPEIVVEYDNRILSDEWEELMPKTEHYTPPYPKLGVEVTASYSPAFVAMQFLTMIRGQYNALHGIGQRPTEGAHL